MGSNHPQTNALFSTCTDPQTGATWRAQALARVSTWRWGSASMSFHTPFAHELYGNAPARWLGDARASAREHVHHGLDAQGQIVFEREPLGRETVHLYTGTPGQPQQRQSITWYADGRLESVCISLWRDGLLASDHLHMGSRGIDTEYQREGQRLLRSVLRQWRSNEPPALSQYVFSYDTGDTLERITLQYLDAQGQVQAGADRLTYVRLPKGESLKTIEARVQSLLLQALPAALAQIPRDEPIYALLLCYTSEDLAAAWPPFLVWGRERYRQQVLARGEDVRDHLWAPAEIQATGDASELWLAEPDLCKACLLHSQLMETRQSHASALRVLNQVVPLLEDMALQAGLNVTDDFVVAQADNTGELDPLKAMKKRLTPERWAALQARGFV